MGIWRGEWLEPVCCEWLILGLFQLFNTSRQHHLIVREAINILVPEAVFNFTYVALVLETRPMRFPTNFDNPFQLGSFRIFLSISCRYGNRNGP